MGKSEPKEMVARFILAALCLLQVARADVASSRLAAVDGIVGDMGEFESALNLLQATLQEHKLTAAEHQASIVELKKEIPQTQATLAAADKEAGLREEEHKAQMAAFNEKGKVLAAQV